MSPLARRFALVVALLAFLPSFAADGTVYGKGVGSNPPVKVSDLLDHPDQYLGKTVGVEGLVVEVCEKRGCWIELAGDREFETMRVKVDDGVIVFPISAKGHRAIAEGVFEKIELSAEQAAQRAKHRAEKEGKPCSDEEAGKAPRVGYQIRGVGAVVR
jgi:hypothetical protein